MRTQILITASLALALSAPAALAYWSGHGGFEPDFPADVADQFMFTDPDWNPNSAHQQVYFHAFLSVEGTSVNPNLGVTQSRLFTSDFQQPLAFLGIWKDCNRDGYIGQVESAIMEYRSEILTDLSVCPEGSSDFHRDGWVYEFRWIGSADNVAFAGDQPLRMINDTEARVWGDIGLPGANREGSETCWVNPPTGTFASTGGVLNWLDCNTGRAVANAITTFDPTGQLGFDDPRQPQCSDSALNVELDVWDDDPNCDDGNAGILQHGARDDAPATATDCEESQHVVGPTVDNPAKDPVEFPENPLVQGVDPADSFTPSVFVPGVSPSTGSGSSAFETANATWTDTIDQCDPNSAGAPYVTGELAVTSGSAGKRETDIKMEFGSPEFSGLGMLLPGALLGEQGQPPHNFGLGYPTNLQGAAVSPMWRSWAAFTTFYLPVRGDPTTGDSVEGNGPAYFSFYARVGGATLSTGAITPGGTGFYGAEWCDGVYDDRIVDGFDCLGERWWKEEFGSSAMATELWSTRPIGQVPGAEYNLRDIDCYDGSVTSLVPEARGVGLGLTLLNEDAAFGPCAYYAAE